MPEISAIIISFNEEASIARCIRSLQGVADEIIVLDSFSTDRTPGICRELGVRFFQQAFRGYIEQKNDALDLAAYDHVLCLDADEALSARLRESVLEVKTNWTHDAWRFNRLNRFCGQWIKHTNYYPDRKLRLFDRRKGRWGGTNPHDKVIMQKGASLGFLQGDLLHWMCDSLEEHFQSIAHFARIAALQAMKKGESPSAWKVIIKPLWRFFQYYILKMGFLDGYMGFVVSRNSAMLSYQKYARLRELGMNQGRLGARQLISVILTTYNQPEWLEKVLWGYDAQLDRHFELLIADDGSDDRTRSVIDRFKKTTDLRLKHIWHEDKGFDKCGILNKAIVASESDYLVFSDGDCVPRNDFIEVHRREARQGYFLSGGYFKLSGKASLNAGKASVDSQRLFCRSWLQKNGQPFSYKMLKLSRRKWISRIMTLITPTGATWNGHNVSGWKQDILKVNGYNEDMQYGGLDRELGERLINSGIQGRQIRYKAVCVHLDHPRPWKTPQTMQKNRAIRDRVIHERITFTPNGIIKPDPANNTLSG